MRSWGQDKDVHTPEDLIAVATASGMTKEEVEACMKAMKSDKVKEALREVTEEAVDRGACMEAMKSDKVKEALREVTEEAVDRGAFGAPTMYFNQEGKEEEMFWGSDR